MRDGDKLMLVAAAYAMYLLVFATFGLAFTGVWLDVAATYGVVVLALWLGWTQARELRPLFVLLAVSAAFDFANLLLLNRPFFVSTTAWSELVGSNQVPLSKVCFGLFLFFWDCAWLYLAATLVRRSRPGPAHWMALVVLVGFIGAYVEQYRSFAFNPLDAVQRITLLMFVLELAGILLGVMCTLLGLTRPFLFMFVGFAVFAAIDIVSIDLQLRGDSDVTALQPVWALGHVLIFTGAWLLLRARPPRTGAGTEPDRPPADDLIGHRHRSSQLSGLLIVFSLGAVFIVAAVERLLEGAREWFAMFFVLFCVGAAVVMALATSRLDRAIGHVRDEVSAIFRSRLARTGPGDGGGNRGILRLTGLDDLLADVRHEAVALRQEVIVLGPERLNRPLGAVAAGAGAPRCFIMMKFGAPWSTAVAGTIREVCRQRGVVAIRGDDIFSPTDILDDIWQQIMEADFVIADLTERNTNVFYELGMAHAVGKPVILLSQHEEDVPIDLKTRRWLPYDPARPDELAERVGAAVDLVLEKYQLAERVAPRRA